jgi:hypothetical protein
MLDREALGRKIVQVASDHAAGYERNISDSNTERENDTAKKCAIAASNTGYFLLKALGYSEEEIKSFRLSDGR